jgi:hypothetical protein
LNHRTIIMNHPYLAPITFFCPPNLDLPSLHPNKAL